MARVSLIAGAIAVLAVVLLVGIGSGLFVDALWFRQLGVLVVFRTALIGKLACFVLPFAACWAVIAAIGLAALRHTRTAGMVQVVRRSGDGPVSLPDLLAPVTHRLPWRALVLAGAVPLALLVAASQVGSWQTYLLWLNGGSFGVEEPFFGSDVGFFIFTLPAYQQLIGAAIATVMLAGLLVVAVLWLRGALDLRRPGYVMPPVACSLLSLLLALFLLVKAAGYWIGRYELLLEPYGAVFGAGYTAAHVKLPFQWLLVVVALSPLGSRRRTSSFRGRDARR